MQTHPRSASLKEKKDKQQLILTVEEVGGIARAKRVLGELENEEAK